MGSLCIIFSSIHLNLFQENCLKLPPLEWQAAPAELTGSFQLSEALPRGSPTPPQTPKTAVVIPRRLLERPRLGNISVDISFLVQNMNSLTAVYFQRKWLTLLLLAQPFRYSGQWDFCYAPLAKAMSCLIKFNGQSSCLRKFLTWDQPGYWSQILSLYTRIF